MDLALSEFEGTRQIPAGIRSKVCSLEITYDLTEIVDARFPIPGSLMREGSLWESTCMELFAKNPSATEYLEFNASPRGAWNAYYFDDYRNGMKETYCAKAVSISREGEGQFQVCYEFAKKIRKPLLLTPAVIIKNVKGSLCYFAPGHGREPDFHDFSNSVCLE
ncbi:MAG: hypothetical protein CMQ40_11065 [Gammaproteobacteria bacterium]|mgnify:CR=1 FL=1|nr:hypothetical protein [Gammaproteobacteria bacterium]|tara:strand:- start:311 stop:802 length:492 start_codon:yes stop_codon:yes gene_type:complete